jgi:hypothetical protein
VSTLVQFKSSLAYDTRHVVRCGSPIPEVRKTFSCHVSCVRPLWYSIFGVGCCMARPKETTIERIYREVTGRRMPPSVKRILLPKPRKRH